MDDLILKYLQGNCTESEKESLFDWIELSAENKSYFRQMRHLWDMNNLLEAPSNTEQLQEAYSKVNESLFPEKPMRRNRFVRMTLQYAAVALVCFGLSWYFWKNKSEESDIVWQNIEVPVGQRVKLTLADGTLVWLNSKSKFSFPAGFHGSNRTVKLNGEAYLEVAHNQKLPFIVQTKQATVTVKGTKFNLYAYENEPNVETTLLEGKVSFSDNSETPVSRDLEPHQQLIYNSENKDVKLVEDINDQQVISWVSGAYFFNNITIRDIIARLTHYYDVQVEVKDSSILDYTCIGKFRLDESLEDVLQVISITKPFKYKIIGNKVIISSMKNK